MKDIFLLDMDETLLDFPRAERENFFATLARFSVPADEALYARFHAVNDALWKLLERGGITREELKIRRFRVLFGERGIGADADAVARAYFGAFPEYCYPYEGAADFVRELSRRGRVYIVTNGGAYIQRRHIEIAGFGPYLSGAFISEEAGANKPSGAFVSYVAAGLGDFERARAVYLGDSLTSDMVCAQRLGVQFVLYCASGAPEGYGGAYVRDYGTFLARYAAR